jgi:regulator of cell morphogenesis and NO signaling
MMSFAEQSLGEVASQLPGATRLFRQYHMDFCCGGTRSLREEAERKGADLNELVSALETLRTNPSAEKNWKKASTKDLIAHILARYHVRHREQLPELIHLAEKVERVHAEHPDVPTGLAIHLMEMLQELEGHMQKEERILFPMLMRGQGRMAIGPISVMESEHVQHGEALEKMLMLAHQLCLPDSACNSWRALYLGVGELRDDLMEHIHLENNILFKQQPSTYPGVCCGQCSS